MEVNVAAPSVGCADTSPSDEGEDDCGAVW
jgi:hypothetical protein